jgi:HEAT repeat protein
VNSLLRTHPQQAEKIRTTLIAALEKEGAEFARPSTQDAQTTEEQAEYVAALTEAVAALQDPRAVNGLVLALPAGSIPGLVDICPAAAEALIERVHEPDVYEEGQPMGYRGLPITALAWCLQRPAMMRTNPEMVDKIRVGLLGMLHDPNPIVRGSAAAALSPLRMEPQVQEALRTLAASDPYRGTGYYGTGYDDAGIGTPDGGFMVREAAAKSLSPLPGFSFYVTRTQGARVCRMQEASEAPIEDRFMGPEREAMLRSEMCSHYDPTGQDPSLCWKVEPANVCSQ